MTALDELWYKHFMRCPICIREDGPRCLVGELIYLEILKQIEKECASHP